LPGGFTTQFVVVMLVIFLLGFFLDFIEIAVVVVPIVTPILLSHPEANVTAVWLGVMIGLNMQTSFLTPPFGFALFYLRGVASKAVKTLEIYKGVVPFIILQLVGLVIVGLFPPLVNYLPNRVYLTSQTAPPARNPKLQTCLEEVIFPKLLSHEQAILEASGKIRHLVNEIGFEDQYAKRIESILTKSEQSFDLVKVAQKSKDDFGEISKAFKPLHSEISAMINEQKKYEKQIKKLEREKNDQIYFAKNNSGEQAIEAKAEIALIETKITDIKNLILNLEAQIPSHWNQAKADFSKARTQHQQHLQQYRKNNDRAFEEIVILIKEIEDQKKILQIQPRINLLIASFNNIKNAETDFEKNELSAHLIEEIKMIETKLSKIEGASEIKSSLSKARRLLNKKKNDMAKTISHYEASKTLLQSELNRREKAKGALLSELTDFKAQITDTIGARMQPRLNLEQAKEVAACQSYHRDVSLYF
ncbi:MAG: TRAP transporter large permease subunit, partial [Pseudomonadota bacterium]